jgi:hypothetical protein
MPKKILVLLFLDRSCLLLLAHSLFHVPPVLGTAESSSLQVIYVAEGQEVRQ